MEGCGQIHVTVQDDEQQPVEAALSHQQVVKGEQCVLGVPQRLPDLPVQLLCHHLRSVVPRATDDGDDPYTGGRHVTRGTSGGIYY